MTKLRSNADLTRVQREMFSMEVFFAEKSEDLRLVSGKGEPRRLVLLRGDAEVGDSVLPDCLDAGVSQEMMDDAMAGKVPQVPADEVDDTDPHHEDLLLQEEHMNFQAEQDEVQDTCDDLVWASSDDELPEEITQTGCKKVKSFMNRPEFKSLEARGLAMLPRHKVGVYLGHHGTTSTWQGFYPGGTTGLSFTYGPKTKSVLAPRHAQKCAKRRFHLLAHILLNKLT